MPAVTGRLYRIIQFAAFRGNDEVSSVAEHRASVETKNFLSDTFHKWRKEGLTNINLDQEVVEITEGLNISFERLSELTPGELVEMLETQNRGKHEKRHIGRWNPVFSAMGIDNSTAFTVFGMWIQVLFPKEFYNWTLNEFATYTDGGKLIEDMRARLYDHYSWEHA